jgi:hypothetical protein
MIKIKMGLGTSCSCHTLVEKCFGPFYFSVAELYGVMIASRQVASVGATANIEALPASLTIGRNMMGRCTIVRSAWMQVRTICTRVTDFTKKISGHTNMGRCFLPGQGRQLQEYKGKSNASLDISHFTFSLSEKE